MASTYNQARLEESKRAILQRYPSFATQLFAFLERDQSTICWANNKRSRDLSTLRVNPSNAIKRQFGIELEIPVLIATYADEEPLQPRVLRYIDTWPELRAGNSSSKDFAILVATDSAAEAYTKNRKHFSYPILTLNTDAIRDGSYTDTDLRQEITRLMRSMNHFDNSNEIQLAADFFGRTQEVEALTNLAAVGQSIGIFGLRRAGKTSLLYRLRERLNQRGIGSVYVELNLLVTADQFRDQLVLSTANALEDSGGMVPGNSGMLNPDFSLRDEPSSAATRRWMYEISAMLDQIDKPMVIILDEIDRGNEEVIGFDDSSYRDRQEINSILQSLRGLIQLRTQRGKKNLSLIAAGVAMSVFTSSVRFGRDNQLFGFVSAHPLGPMPRDEMREMVRVLGKRSGLRFDDYRIFDELLAEYGGHPHLTRQACGRIADNASAQPELPVPYRVELDDLQSVFDATAEGWPRHTTYQIFEAFELWYPTEAKAIRQSAGDSMAAPPQDIAHAIEFGICDNQGHVRPRALQKELARELD